MDILYDNLENYEEENIIEVLKNENCELKKKLEQYSSTINQLQIDFDNLSSEYKKLELNYSSLLKTARAEIERKTKMITQLNDEKDMMVVQAFQSKGKRCFKNITCNKNFKPMKTDYESRPKNQESHYKSLNKSTSGHTPICTIDSKEDILDSKQKISKNITSDIKSIPVLSQFKKRCDDEPIHQLKDPRIQDDESLEKNKRCKVKNSDSFNYESKHLSHKGSASTKSDNERHSNYSYRQRDRSQHRRKSPTRISRHRSSPRLRSRSPPADRFSGHRSRDRRNNYYDSQPSANREIIPVNPSEAHVLKHKLLPNAEEPSHKKIRVASYGTYPSSEKSSADGGFLSFSPALMSPEDPFRSCQSPDYLNYNVDQSLIKEIIHTAITPQDDPRLTSKKYHIQSENGKEFLKSMSSNEVYLRRVDRLHWGIPKVTIPDALLQKPSNLQSYSENEQSGLCHSFDPMDMVDNSNFSNSNENCGESITKTLITSEIPNVCQGISSSHINKDSYHSTNNAELQNSLPNSLKPQAQTTNNNIPFINGSEQTHEGRDLGSLSAIEGDLLLSDEASENSEKAVTTDGTTLAKIKPTKSSKNTLTNQRLSGNKTRKRYELIEKRERFDNKNVVLQSIKEGCNPGKKDSNTIDSHERDKSNVPEKKGNYFEHLTKTKCTEDTVLLSKDTDRDMSATTSLETIKAEVTLLNRNEISKETSIAEFEVVPDQSNDKVVVEIPSKIKNKQGSEERSHAGTKLESPKREKSTDLQCKETISNKKLQQKRKKKLGESKFKERDKTTTKDKPNIADNTITPDSKRKFSELFGESSNSLIMPEDLGIKNREAVENETTKFSSICDDTQSAVDLNLDNATSKISDPSRKTENVADIPISIMASDNLLNGTVICGDTQSPEKLNLFENIKPATSMDSADVVIISTGIQSKITEDDTNGILKGILPISAHAPTALATSTPLKEAKSGPACQSAEEAGQERHAGDQHHEIPDVRIFVKRRRKLKKP